MSILDFFKRSSIPTLLDEGMDERLQQTIRNDVINYNISTNKSLYSMSSYGFTITFSDKKSHKMGFDIDKSDPYDIHKLVKRHLKEYTRKCLKSIDATFYVDYGKKDKRYHLHGYTHGDANQVNKLLKHCRTVFGFCKLKDIFDFDPWHQYCVKTQTELLIQLHKNAPKGRGKSLSHFSRKCETPPPIKNL